MITSPSVAMMSPLQCRKPPRGACLPDARKGVKLALNLWIRLSHSLHSSGKLTRSATDQRRFEIWLGCGAIPDEAVFYDRGIDHRGPRSPPRGSPGLASQHLRRCARYPLPSASRLYKLRHTPRSYRSLKSPRPHREPACGLRRAPHERQRSDHHPAPAGPSNPGKALIARSTLGESSEAEVDLHTLSD